MIIIYQQSTVVRTQARSCFFDILLFKFFSKYKYVDVILKSELCKKRARCTNFSATEKNTLVTLAVKHFSVLECKKLDHDVWESKNVAWRQIQEDFIAATGNNREVSRSYLYCTLV